MHLNHLYPLRTSATMLFVGSSILAALVSSPNATTHAAVSSTPVLVQTIDTSEWNPPSPDPSGITYWSRHDHLVVVDGEVEEMAIWAGANMFEATRAGGLVKSYNTTSFNKEPVGIDIEIGPNDHFFISNDSQKTIFDIDIGSDGVFGTSDDKRRPFLTSGFGNTDPEGLTLGAGKLYTVDGGNREVYITEPGSNGIFEASDPTTHFDVDKLGIRDPEGIDYDPRTGNLWIVDRSRGRLNEVTLSGNLLQTIDLEALAGAVNPADVTLAPGSDNTGEQHLYIVERGIDNNVDPNENDGKIYEITFTDNPPLPPPTGNFLKNPGFEDDANNDSRPDIWSINTKFTRSNAVHHSGEYSGKFFATDNSGATIKQKVSNLTAGVTYTLSAWMNAPTTSDSFKFRLRVQWRNASNSTIRTDTFVEVADDTAGGWQFLANSLVAPVGTTSAFIQLNVASLNGTVYVDDMEFK
jgi:hypothetical protein